MGPGVSPGRRRLIGMTHCLERQRLDKWLWHARVVKARSTAAALVEAGHVRINGIREKAPRHGVKVGDVLTIGLDRSVRILKVVGFAERRGEAGAARRPYLDFPERSTGLSLLRSIQPFSLPPQKARRNCPPS